MQKTNLIHMTSLRGYLPEIRGHFIKKESVDGLNHHRKRRIRSLFFKKSQGRS